MNGDRSALSAEEQGGLQLFRGKANCVACHVGPNFTDEHFHNSGVAWRDGRFQDEGRFAVTGKADRGAFKTPTLREIARTAPYMHDGSLARLRGRYRVLRSRREPKSGARSRDSAAASVLRGKTEHRRVPPLLERYDLGSQ